jgi:hypothetical protein
MVSCGSAAADVSGAAAGQQPSDGAAEILGLARLT